MNYSEVWKKYDEEKSKIVVEQNKLVDCSEDFYFDAPGMNASSLKDLLRSPAHFIARRVLDQKKKETPALLFGRLLHLAVLESEKFLSKKIVQPTFDKRTTKGKEDYAKWVRDLPPGAIIVTEEHAYMLTRIIQSVQNFPLAKNLISNGVREKCVWWTDSETKELCKMKLDFLNDKGWIVDLKSTEDASPATGFQASPFERQIHNYKYDVQVGWYDDGVKQGLNLSGGKFAFLAVEKEEPFEIGVYNAGQTIFEMGHKKARKALKTFVECKTKNDWPGYMKEAMTVELPQYALNDDNF